MIKNPTPAAQGGGARILKKIYTHTTSIRGKDLRVAHIKFLAFFTDAREGLALIYTVDEKEREKKTIAHQHLAYQK